jgi:hypothetical protein
MSDDHPGFDALSAYVDGELPHEQSARVAAAAAVHPGVAQDVATLQALRASVAAIGREVVLAPIVPPPPPRRRRLAVAAAAAAFAIGGAAFVHDANRQRPSTQGSGEAAAALFAAHDAFAAGQAGHGVVGANGASFEGRLAAAGLALVHSGPAPARPGAAGWQYGFAGPRGCKLSLFEIEGAVAGPDAAPAEADVALAQWTADGRSYLAIARGMDAGRFDHVVAALREATQPAGERLGDRLAADPAARLPCRA